jgi:hypothetical protein
MKISSFFCGALIGLAGVLLSSYALPSHIFAFSGSGDGSGDDPYEITSCAEFKEISNEDSAEYELLNDLDCSTDGTDIMISTFGGIFEGNNHRVTVNILASDDWNIGLFRTLDAATVSNLTIAGTLFVDQDASGIGALAGNITSSTITNITSTATITGVESVGGIAGSMISSTVTHVRATGSVSGVQYVGGIVGLTNNLTTITESYSTAAVSCPQQYCGGFVGYNEGQIFNAYTRGTVTAGDVTASVGGFVGYNTTSAYITDTYAATEVEILSGADNAGNFAGENDGAIEQSFVDSQVGDLPNDCGIWSNDCSEVFARTTEELKIIDTYDIFRSSWDFATVWQFASNINSGYPHFIDFAPDPDASPDASSSSQTSQSSGNNLGSSSRGLGQPHGCSDTAPVGSVDLFQADVTTTQATLYFAPVSHATYYFISYGEGSETERHGAIVSNPDNSGVIRYTINSLQPHTAYTFKVRAGAGCMPGSWGNVLHVSTRKPNGKSLSYYKSFAPQLTTFLFAY